MDYKDLKVKYYETFIVGTAKTDPSGVPVDANGVSTQDPTKMVPEFIRVGNPSAEVVAAIGRGKFIQAQFIEIGESDPFKNLGGKQLELGPLAGRGKTVVLFESRYRVVYNALAERINAGKTTLIVPVTERIIAGGKKIYTCTAKVNDFAMPGYHLKTDCGFDHFMYQRSALTHKLEKRLTPGWDDNGKWDNNKCSSINWVDVFLFADEIIAAEALIKAEIAIAKRFIVPGTGDTNHVA
jgi:hypothetical protein